MFAPVRLALASASTTPPASACKHRANTAPTPDAGAAPAAPAPDPVPDLTRALEWVDTLSLEDCQLNPLPSMAHIAKPMRRHWAPVLEAALQLLLSDFTSRAHHKQYYLLPRLVLRPLARTGKGKTEASVMVSCYWGMQNAYWVVPA